MAWVLGIIVLWLAVYLFLRKVWFYRDPIRRPAAPPGSILSPADGTVVYMRPFKQGKVVCEKLGEQVEVAEICKGGHDYSGDGWLVGVYMSPLDVHFNYAPVSATVEGVISTPAAVNLPMVDLWEYVKLTYLRRAVDLFSHKFRLVNERNTVFLGAAGGSPRIVLVEIADKFVNKIKCFVKPGDTVAAGDKISFIDRGSQVDMLIYDENIEFKVKPGQHVTGALTVIATFKPRNP